MARSEKVNVRLTPAQVEMLKKLAAKDESSKELLAAVEKPARVAGGFEQVMREMLANPDVKLTDLAAKLPAVKERNLKYDFKRAQKVVKIMREIGWREPTHKKAA